jgi:hypothetical protein
MGSSGLFLGGIARVPGFTAGAAVKWVAMGRGINGGDPRLRGEAAVYAAKARCDPLDGEPAVIG